MVGDSEFSFTDVTSCGHFRYKVYYALLKMAEVSCPVFCIADVTNSFRLDYTVRDVTTRSFYNRGSICSGVMKDINPH